MSCDICPKYPSIPERPPDKEFQNYWHSCMCYLLLTLGYTSPRPDRASRKVLVWLVRSCFAAQAFGCQDSLHGITLTIIPHPTNYQSRGQGRDFTRPRRQTLFWKSKKGEQIMDGPGKRDPPPSFSQTHSGRIWGFWRIKHHYWHYSVPSED
jgi:hypothetical protein